MMNAEWELVHVDSPRGKAEGEGMGDSFNYTYT